MSATAPNNITDPSTVAEIVNRAAAAREGDDFHFRLAQALQVVRAWGPDQCAAFKRQLSREAIGYLSYHFAPVVRQNAHLDRALRMDRAELVALIRRNGWRWDKATGAE